MREMKNSGIEWLGDIPCDWELSQIKSVYTERKTKVSDKDYPPLSVTMKGIVPQLATAAKSDAHDDRKLVLKGDFAINSRSDRRGSCGISEYDGSVSLINTILCPREQSNPKYYDWLFHTTMFADEFYKWGHGIVDDLWTTNWQDMKRISIPVPPINEQKKIAVFLDEKCAEIDTVIEKTKATIEEYKKLKQSVITQAVTKGIRPNRPMKASGIEWIGEIPADWSVRKLKTFTTQISKGATPKDMSTEKTDFYSIRFLKSENIVDNQLMSVPEFYIEESIHSGELKRSQLSDNDIMFVIAGASIGKVAIVSNELLPANTNQAMSFIRVLEKYREIKKYLWYVLQSDIMKLFITLYSVQSAQPNISMENIGNFRLCVPADFQEIKDILLYLNIKCLEIDELIAKKTSLLSELESYKKSLIYEYVTGKKGV